PGVGAAFAGAAETIGSDYELRRTLAKALERPLGDEVLVRLLRTARSIGSDYELAELLVAVVRSQRLEGGTRDAFAEAAETIGSDYELRRTLAEAVERPLGGEGLVPLLRAALSIGSDFELAELLVAVARSQRLEGEARDAFEAALETVGSTYERRRVEEALASPGAAPSRSR
ncbi:MAG: hypothetical protein R3325_16730, partial [Thermoanaerobaculia bacterium]|nr:hypothetical protein [Thermoanaerobaculia bacterium]